MPTYPPQSLWPPKNVHMNDQSLWNPVVDYQPPVKSECKYLCIYLNRISLNSFVLKFWLFIYLFLHLFSVQQQDGFLNLMASAASMASIQLQSKEDPNQML